MHIRTRTLVWSAAGLLAVGTATGLSAPSLLQSTAQTAPAASGSTAAGATSSQAISPPPTAPNYRAIVERNQAAVVGITTAGAMDTSAREFNFGSLFGDNDTPPSQVFRSLPRSPGK